MYSYSFVSSNIAPTSIMSHADGKLIRNAISLPFNATVCDASA